MTFFLPRRYFDDMVAHALKEAPNECCGILGGKDKTVLGLFRARNAEASPRHYRVHDEDLVRIINELDSRGWELIGIYHSHPCGEAFPSATDVELSFYPDSIYLIISLQDEVRPILRAFHIREGQIREETVIVDEA